jgi:hypothetical protein
LIYSKGNYFKLLGLIILVLAFSVFALSCEESTDNTTPDEYFPLSIGNYWVYISDIGDTTSIEIISSIPKGYEDAIVYQVSPDSAYCSKNDITLLLTKDSDQNWEKDRELIHKPLYKNQEWDYYVGKAYYKTTVWDDDLSLEGKGGKFIHCKLLHTVRLEEGSTSIIEDIYAPNIGLVLKRLDKENTSTWDLSMEVIKWYIND